MGIKTKIVIDLIGIMLAAASIYIHRRMRKEKAKNETEIEKLKAENAMLKTQTETKFRPGSNAHYEAWKAEQMKEQRGNIRISGDQEENRG